MRPIDAVVSSSACVRASLLLGSLAALPLAAAGPTSTSAATERVAVLDLATPGLPPEQGKALSDNLVGLIAAEVARLGHGVISSADIAALLSLERQRDLLGCTDAACLAEIGGALGVPLMLSGQLGKLGEQFSLSLTLIDIARAEARQRFQGSAGSEESLAAAARRGVATLFGAATDAGGTALVVVRTDPDGGAVLLDGKPAGTAPVTLEVAQGDHLLAAARGELRGQTALHVEAGAVQRITLRLERGPPVAVRVLSDPPDGLVLIDGQPAGLAPLLVELPAGEHEIRVELERHIPYRERHAFAHQVFEEGGRQPFKIEARLQRRLQLLPIALQLQAGVLSNLDLLGVGVAPTIEVGVLPLDWLELDIGYAHPATLQVSARGLLRLGGLELGLLLRGAGFAPLFTRVFGQGGALGGGASLGYVVETPAGFFGLRLDGLALAIVSDSASPPVVPLALSALWRL